MVLRQYANKPDSQLVPLDGRLLISFFAHAFSNPRLNTLRGLPGCKLKGSNCTIT
jgi:hypothetical protein